MYRPPSLNSQYSRDKISDLLDFHSSKYGNKVVLGVFNFEPKNLTMMYFMESQYQIKLKTTRQGLN